MVTTHADNERRSDDSARPEDGYRRPATDSNRRDSWWLPYAFMVVIISLGPIRPLISRLLTQLIWGDQEQDEVAWYDQIS